MEARKISYSPDQELMSSHRWWTEHDVLQI